MLALGLSCWAWALASMELSPSHSPKLDILRLEQLAERIEMRFPSSSPSVWRAVSALVSLEMLQVQSFPGLQHLREVS